ncbi:hypothetical protein [Alteromonas macleodii]|uniref:hypothetical protein n=1 Tax=Alteromonas macleodii TaxID=28108 RepID=UPI002076B17D|nr:hypothetical protein [Alteromonas macleodii]USI27902.1 hypothetical protein NFG60_19695 [Alteromonas macleodii]
MKINFLASIPKDLDLPELNEDAYSSFIPDVNTKKANSQKALKKGRFGLRKYMPNLYQGCCKIAISDGASESYNSKLWASMLVEHYTLFSKVSIDDISNLISEYNANHDYQSMSWSQQSAFERGSFATLLGIEFFKDNNSIDILSIGDSLLVLIDEGELKFSYPYSSSSEFDQRPTLLSTKFNHNNFITSEDFVDTHYSKLDLDQYQSPTLMLMTDALGQWCLKQQELGNSVWENLRCIDHESLKNLVLIERKERRMRTDDVTLVVVET